MKQTLYINKTSINNNKYFKNHLELLNISKDKLQEIKEHKKRLGFLHNRNTKLGPGIFSFDLPAVVSCPNSDSCFKTCYANKKTFLYKSVRNSNEYNFAIALNDLKYLEIELKKEIKNKNITAIRIHSSGDFFSKEYFLMWCNIARTIKNINIFTYSKAPQIKGLQIPSNLNIIPSIIKHKNTNYLNYGTYENMKELRNKISGLMCPPSKGAYLKNEQLKNVTCTMCKYCIKKSKPVFVQH